VGDQELSVRGLNSAVSMQAGGNFKFEFLCSTCGRNASFESVGKFLRGMGTVQDEEAPKLRPNADSMPSGVAWRLGKSC